MTKGIGLSALNPRNVMPSRGEPKERKVRKDLEKEHGYGYTEPILLTLLGVGLIWNIEKQVKDHEERKNKRENEEKTQQEMEDPRRRRGENGSRRGVDDSSDFPPSSKDQNSERWGESRGRGDRAASRDTRDSRKRSRDARNRPRWHDDRNEDWYDDRYDDQRRSRSADFRSRRDTL